MGGSVWSKLPDASPSSSAQPGLGAVLALKPLSAAKSRLALAPALRRRLALAMFVDTLTAVSAVAEQVVVVSDEPALRSRLARFGIDVAVRAEDRPDGLNAALRQGADWLIGRRSGRILACLGDLPALTPATLRSVLALAVDHRQAFLPDAEATGTTMLITDADAFDPRFGVGSAQAHRRAGAHDLTSDRTGLEADDHLLAARRDVDTAEDLRAASVLGLGDLTGALVDRRTGELGRLMTITVAQQRVADDTRHEIEPGTPVITDDGRRVWLPTAAVQDHDRDRPARLRPGQGLHAVTSGGRIVAAWI